MRIDDEHRSLPEKSPAKDLKSLFEGITNKSVVDNDGRSHIEIRHNGQIHNVGIAITDDELMDVKTLDDAAFGVHQGISLEELKLLTENGRVLILRDNDGNLIGESQIQLSHFGDHPAAFDESREAFCYGTAVKPGLEGTGVAQILYKAQEVLAREAGKEALIGTVRVENAASIRARLKAGFRITGYDPSYYGNVQDGGARLIIRKPLIEEPIPYDPHGQARRIRDRTTRVAITAQPTLLFDRDFDEVAISVTPGDGVDLTAHAILEPLFERDFIGIGLLRPQEVDPESLRDDNLLILRKSDQPFPPETSTFPSSVVNEYGKVLEVVIGFVPENSNLTPVSAINPVAASNIGNVDPIAKKDENNAFIRTLQKNGIATIHSGFSPSKDNSGIFTRDPGFMLGNNFIIGKMGREKRQAEADAFKQISGIKNVIELISDSSDKAVIEGGDVIIIGDKKVAVGLGQRSNVQGFERLKERLPEYEFVSVEHTDLHLDVLFTVVGERKALIERTQLPASFIELLQDEGYELITADPVEQITLGCNVFAIDDNKVIAASQNTKTNNALKAAGVEVIEVDLPNVTKSGGGPRCMTCPTSRE